MYALIGLAVLAKGPVGMLLPLAAMGVFLLVTDGWRKLFWSAWWMRPFTALLVIMAVAVPWYVWVGVETHGEWLRKFFIEFNLRPFKQPILSHGDVSSLDRAMAILVSILYYFYYIPAILCGFFPWAVFLGPTLVDTVRRIRGKGDQGSKPGWRDGCLLASCWFGTWFVFWSICKTKLPHYLLPAYPALALLTACFIDRWLAEPASLPRWCLRNAWISTILVGVGFLIAVPIVAKIFLPGEQWLGLATFGLVGLSLILGGGWCWREASRGRHRQAAVGFAVMSVLFLTAVFGFAPLQVDKFQNARPMIAAIRADWAGKGDRPPIATYQFFRESTVFYAGHPVTRCEDDRATGRSAQQQLDIFARTSNGRFYVITTDECAREINKAFPGKFREISASADSSTPARWSYCAGSGNAAREQPTAEAPSMRLSHFQHERLPGRIDFQRRLGGIAILRRHQVWRQRHGRNASQHHLVLSANEPVVVPMAGGRVELAGRRVDRRHAGQRVRLRVQRRSAAETSTPGL